MLINLQSRVIEADFHTYVRPIENPKLDHFCEDYTGITQNDVNEGMLLSDTIRKFHEWIRKLRITKDVRLMDENNCKQNTVFVTWTDFDLGIYLPKECARKHIKLPAYFDKWIDIRDYYSVSVYFVSFSMQIFIPFLFFTCFCCYFGFMLIFAVFFFWTKFHLFRCEWIKFSLIPYFCFAISVLSTFISIY